MDFCIWLVFERGVIRFPPFSLVPRKLLRGLDAFALVKTAKTKARFLSISQSSTALISRFGFCVINRQQVNFHFFLSSPNSRFPF
uniref:Uncharacterized protein n=1 Tax=Candidatus Kentrum sp. DK TaxID=2126562 RepID=A0A450T5I7_9GAMM|nr:MAG: hypothetical protein BECKDK2373B_GA0170837_110519 [Candidatus Kentron sp. DK]